MSEKKTIVLGVTGCIAAYKACEILRGFQKAGFDVRVVMTKHACEFVGEATFRALSGHDVITDLFDCASDPIAHIGLAEAADAFVIAPCTANVLAKIVHGLADDALTSAALAMTCPVVVAPAMNSHMFENPATQANIAMLRNRGITVLEPDEGQLACGVNGLGRLPEPQTIVEAVLDALGEADDSASPSLKEGDGALPFA